MFIVFEGIDGSGKTTISNAVVQRLVLRGAAVKHLRAGGKFASTVTEGIRSLARDAANLALEPKAEFLLYVAREVQLIDEVLATALGTHDVVVADRFLYTAEVLARYGRQVPAPFIEPVLRAARAGFEPDLVVLVDVDPALARARRRVQKIGGGRPPQPPSRKGLTGTGLQQRLRRGYLELAAADPARWVVLPNDLSLEAGIERVLELVELARTSGVAGAVSAFREQQAAEAAAPASASSPARSKEEALAAFVQRLEHRAVAEPAVAAYFLSGLAGAAVDALRRSLARRAPEILLFGVRGLDDDESWNLRDGLRALHPRAVAATLGGFSSTHDRASRFRTELFAEAAPAVVESLEGLDDAAAWDLRERLYPLEPAAVVGSLRGLQSDRAWEMRDAFLSRHAPEFGTSHELATIAARSVAEVPGDRAYRVRDVAQRAAPLSALKSLVGLEDPRSWTIRERYLGRAPKTVMATLRQMRHPEAFRMREQAAPDCREALDGIVGMDDAAAWRLREASLDVWPSTVVKSLGALADAPRGASLVLRQLRAYPGNISLLKHCAAVALGTHRSIAAGED